MASTITLSTLGQQNVRTTTAGRESQERFEDVRNRERMRM